LDLELIKVILRIIVLVATVLGAGYLPRVRKKAKAFSVFFGDLSESFKDPAQTEADFDKLWQDAEVCVADPPGQPTTWADVLKIDWGPDGFWKAIKGPAFIIAYVLLAVSGGLLALMELLLR
jgi:hypothetical protein